MCTSILIVLIGDAILFKLLAHPFVCSFFKFHLMSASASFLVEIVYGIWNLRSIVVDKIISTTGRTG